MIEKIPEISIIDVYRILTREKLITSSMMMSENIVTHTDNTNNSIKYNIDEQIIACNNDNNNINNTRNIITADSALYSNSNNICFFTHNSNNKVINNINIYNVIEYSQSDIFNTNIT